MTQKEKRLHRVNSLEEKLAERYERVELNEKVCFLLPSGEVIRLDQIEKWDAIVIEYADGMEMAQSGLFPEDGDLFYMDDMDENEMLQAIVKELDG